MFQDNKNQFLEKLRELGILPQAEGVRFSFSPDETDLLRVRWNSPNDGMENIFRISMDPREFETIKIKDNH